MNYIHESDSSILVLLQTAEKYPDKLDILFTLQNIASLLGIGFTLDFGFKIYRDLTTSAPFQLGFRRCISLYTDVTLFFFSFFSKNLLPPRLPPCAGGQQIPRGFSFLITRARWTSKRK